MMHKVFVYGTLKQNGVNSPLLHNSNYLGEAVLTSASFRMYEVQGNMLFPALVQVEEDGYQVFGELHEVDDDCIKNLDILEGVDMTPPLYDKILTQAQTSDGRLYEDVIVYRFLRDTKNLQHVGQVWPSSSINLSHCLFLGHSLKRSTKEVIEDGVALWDKSNECFVTNALSNQDDLVAQCRRKASALGGEASSDTPWSQNRYEVRPRSLEKTIKLQKIDDSPEFTERKELFEWAAENMTLFGGRKADAGEWSKIVAEASPLID